MRNGIKKTNLIKINKSKMKEEAFRLEKKKASNENEMHVLKSW